MIEHFDSALSTFETQARGGKANVQIVHKDGSHGGGAFTWRAPGVAWSCCESLYESARCGATERTCSADVGGAK
jgi:hypothetical protein